MSPKKKRVLIYLFLYELVVGGIVLFFKFNTLGYVLLSWLLPALWFFNKLPTFRVRYLFESLFWSVPGSIIIDYLGHHTKTWEYWSNPLFSSTDLWIGPLPLESYAWALFFWLFTISTYKYFFDKHRTHEQKWGDKLLGLGLLAISLFIVYYVDIGVIAQIEFYYAWLLGFSLVISLLVFIFKKRLAVKTFTFAIMSFFLGLIVEFVSLKGGFWEFSGGEEMYLRVFDFGWAIVPVEELLWWLILPMAIVAMHEFFADTGD